MTSLSYPISLREEMLAHVKSVFPEEACGLLVGENNQALRVIPVTNQLHSPVCYLMDPDEQVRALLWIEEHQLELLAIYHSHPTGPTKPSETDIQKHYYPDSLILIWVKCKENWFEYGYQMTQNGFISIELKICER